MTRLSPYLAHLSISSDLVTTYEARRAGFVRAALEKNRLADPFVQDAKTLRITAQKASTPMGLLEVEGVHAGLLTAAGLSDKAIKNLEQHEKRQLVEEFIKNILLPAGDDFVEELVYRFLLIRGDTLGGKMRNITGVWAQRRVVDFVLSELKLSGTEYYWLREGSTRWSSEHVEDATEKVKAVSWSNDSANRVLWFNVKLPIIVNEEERVEGSSGKGKGIDIVLFSCEPHELTNKKRKDQTIRRLDTYLALGELKGGIDPAGADEHWKTGDSALARARRAFGTYNLQPPIFFVGAAIAPSMAGDIWGMLSRGEFSNAANLTKDEQMVSLVSWLFSL